MVRDSTKTGHLSVENHQPNKNM